MGGWIGCESATSFIRTVTLFQTPRSWLPLQSSGGDSSEMPQSAQNRSRPPVHRPTDWLPCCLEMSLLWVHWHSLSSSCWLSFSFEAREGMQQQVTLFGNQIRHLTLWSVKSPLWYSAPFPIGGDGGEGKGELRIRWESLKVKMDKKT